MLKQACLYFVLFLTLNTQKCYVSSGGALGDTIIAAGTPPQTDRRYSTHSTSNDEQYNLRQQQNVHPHAPQHHAHSSQQHHAVVTPHHHGAGGGGSSNVAAPVVNSHAVYHPGSGAHVEHRNSYNLLSEAMSQAVSNEFSALGSGSADGACHADDLDCYSGNVQDRLGMEAIRTLHRQLDDDDNGNIDLSESDDFLREELKYDSGYEKRQKAFHFNDDMHISVKELWEAWLRSEVHNWTIEQTTDWLAQSVQLPQYVELFKVHKVTGAALPRLAVNNMHYVGNVLGIKDPIHKQKIALKAMDVVLFGPPRETGTRWKDYILVTLLLSAIIGCWYAYQQNKNAKRHLRRMAQDMEGLQRAEQSLQEMQKELERARMEQENVATEKMDLERRLKEAPSLSSSSSDLEVQQLKKEIEMLRTELSRAEIELVDNCWSPPPQLQSWLQYTYELESKNHLKKRVSAEKQLQTAREACEKLRKKRSSLVGAFVSTHGKSIDDVDRSIVEARNSLGEVTHELQERLHRWKQIESCLGLNICNNNGLPYLESVLYGRNGVPSKGSRGRMTSSTDDLDDDSVQGMLDNYSRSSVSAGLGSSIINSSSNTIRDDSSCSDDGTDTPQGVQFYLGSAPTPTVPASLINASMQRTHLPLDVSNMNHIGNNVTAATPVAVSAAAPPSTTLASTANAPPPPLPPHHNNAHSSFSLNDSVVIVGSSDDSRHSPSVSSERSIPVPPRSKKPQPICPSVIPTSTQQTPLIPPPPSGQIGRAPLPPPRKSNQSQLLRSQSTEVVPMEIYSFISRQQQQQQQHQLSKASGGNASQQQFLSTGGGNCTTGISTIGGGGSKKMVKQHSTASQQSTSSTSSSVQSAPANSTDNGKGHSPNRWSSHERVMPLHHHEHQLIYHHQQQQYQQQQHQQQQHISDKEPLLQSHYSSGTATAAVPYQHRPQHQMSASHSLQSLCGKPQYGSGTSAATAASAATSASSHSDTRLEDQLLLATIDNSSSLDGSLKKRKRRLRFPFGGSGGSKKSSASSGGGKSKLT